MGIQEEATRLHQSGFNCAQSVLCACCKYTGLDEKTALAISGGFGGGMRCGELCGTLTSGVMALGLYKPYIDQTDSDAKETISKLTKEFTRRFKEENSCLRCVELKQSGHGCPELIRFSAQLVEDMILENKGDN